MRKIKKVFIQPACLCPSLILLLFSVISILLQGTVFRLEVVLTFPGEIIAQRVMLFIHAAQLCPAFNLIFMSTSLHPHASPIKAHTKSSSQQNIPDFLSYQSEKKPKKPLCVLKVQFILFQCFKWFCHTISWAGWWKTNQVNILNTTTQVTLCSSAAYMSAMTSFSDTSRQANFGFTFTFHGPYQIRFSS